MITTVLALFTLADSLGEAPSQIISAHKTYAECQNAKQKLLHEKWQEMQKKGLLMGKYIFLGFNDFVERNR